MTWSMHVTKECMRDLLRLGITGTYTISLAHAHALVYTCALSPPQMCCITILLYMAFWPQASTYTGLTFAPVPDPRLGLGPSEWVWELKLAVLPLRHLHCQAAGQGHSTGNG